MMTVRMLESTITRKGQVTTNTYDVLNCRTITTYQDSSSTIYAYNAASELTSLTYKKGATTLGTLLYTYDAAGNRIKTGGTFARSGLPPALSTVSYNANNQQTTFGTNTITYDLNGNLATATDAGVTTTYSWNVRNQLTGISATGFSASFTYDSFGRRTGKTVQGTTTNFVYDGLNPVQEKTGATVTANLLTGLGIDEFFMRTDGSGVRALLPTPSAQPLPWETTPAHYKPSTPMNRSAYDTNRTGKPAQLQIHRTRR